MAEEQPDPKDKILQDYYKRLHTKVDTFPGMRKLSKGMLIFYAVLILAAWGYVSYTLLKSSQTFIWGLLLGIAAIIFAYFYLKAALTKPDFSKYKYKDVSGVMNFYGKVGHNPFIVGVVKFGWRRPLIAIIALTILLIAVVSVGGGHGIILTLFYSLYPIFIGYLVFFGICYAFVINWGSKEVKEWIKNDEVIPKGKLNTFQLIYLLFHKTKPSDGQKKAQEEVQRTAQKAYKTRFRKASKTPLNERKSTGKKS